MPALTRLLLSCLLILVLPLQGLAAGARMHCGATHEPAAAVAPQPSPCPHHDAADEPPPAAHANPHAHGAAVGPDSCSACAWCCHALALPVPEWRLGGLPPGHGGVEPPPLPAPQVLPDRLERPPRTVLG